MTRYEISGPQVFSKWYGESEEILRRIFDDAAAHAPSIIFFDEIDSVAGQREEAHEASRRVVAQLLTLMDGFSPSEEVVVIAATNRPQDVDAALRRPGRLDWEIAFPLPGLAERLEILRVTAKPMTTTETLPLECMAAATEGWSPAALTAIWTEAALLAVGDGRRRINTEDCYGGLDRVREQRAQVERERAAHEQADSSA